MSLILIIQQRNWGQAKQASCTFTFKGMQSYQAESWKQTQTPFSITLPTDCLQKTPRVIKNACGQIGPSLWLEEDISGSLW